MKVTKIDRPFDDDLWYRHRGYDLIKSNVTIEEAEKIATSKASKLKRKYWWRIVQFRDGVKHLYRSRGQNHPDDDDPMDRYEPREYPRDCPHCNSDDIENDKIEPKNYGLLIDHECKTCGGKWFTTYSFSTYHKWKNLT